MKTSTTFILTINLLLIHLVVSPAQAHTPDQPVAHAVIVTLFLLLGTPSTSKQFNLSDEEK